ncbi:hypothetical protein [Methylobacterium planeticum]|uniref:Uncharacterized protein n=1 Tax=Methylobacterium planeticum TaxID=2615211 RepID=A0A6N6MR57_9HYPH|nr:hypothetical protein [Methylobacterium planeticum]KAB1073638.1 hypothetical protein F6X51_10615 [Methylobacterium planeticum]
MIKPPAHPFSITVRPSRLAPGSFSWRINEVGGHCEACATFYASFDEARLAAKARLEILVAEWRSGATEGRRRAS